VNCPQLLDAGETVMRLRAVRNAAPPSANTAIATPAPITALDQSNPSSADELETTSGSRADGAVAASDEYAGFPGSTWCALWSSPAGWLDCSDPLVLEPGYVYAAALAGIASEQAARTIAAARRALRCRRNMVVTV